MIHNIARFLVLVTIGHASGICFQQNLTWLSPEIIDHREGVGDPHLCQAICEDTEGCRAFTWTNSENTQFKHFCFLFASSFNQTSCEGCISGPATCTCSSEVACQDDNDNIADVIHDVHTEADCQNKCLETSSCQFYTWHSAGSFPAYSCVLFNNCEDPVSCHGCLSGPPDCSNNVSITTTTHNPLLKENPKKFCQLGDSCWPTAAEIEAFRSIFGGDATSCLGLKKFVYKEDDYAYHKTCLNYTGFDDEQKFSCASPYEFLTHRRYYVELLKAAFIVTVETPDELAAAIKFANNHSLGIAVMSTGHDQAERNSGPGFDSLLIRTTCLQEWEVHGEPHESGWEEGFAVVGAGLTFGENYWRDLQEGKGLYDLGKEVNREIVGGDCASVGIVGWTLGGGRGYLAVKHGLGVDQVLHVDLVTGNGEIISANMSHNADTFYAIKGGGGGFGIIYRMKIKLHHPSCVHNEVSGEQWENCYQRNYMNMSQVYSSANYLKIGDKIKHIIQSYMTWSIRHRDNCFSEFKLEYKKEDDTYLIQIFATCFANNSWSELSRNMTEYGDWYSETEYRDNYWVGAEKNPVIKLKSDLRSVVNSSTVSNEFVETLLDHWKPMCDKNPRSPCSSGFIFHGNLPALCEYASRSTPCKGSIYNSGGPIPWATRTASFVVFTKDLMLNQGYLTYEESNAWLHQVLAPAMYKYSQTSLYNEPEITMYPGQWERRFWGEENHARLLEIKKKVDPHYNLACRQCVGSEIGESWGCSVPWRQVDNQCSLPGKTP